MSSYGFIKIIKSTQPNQTKYLNLINPHPFHFMLRVKDPNQGVRELDLRMLHFNLFLIYRLICSLQKPIRSQGILL